MIRLYYDGSGGTPIQYHSSLDSSMHASTSANRGRIIQASYVGSDAVSSPTTNIASLVDRTLSYAIEFRTLTPCKNIMVVGDSITQNNTLITDHISCWGYRAAGDASTEANPVGFINCGMSSENSSVFQTEGLVELAQHLPNAVIYQGFSPNDGAGTDAASFEYLCNLQHARISQFVESCRTYGAVPIITTGQPWSASLDSARDAIRLAYKARISALDGTSFCYVFDTDGLWGNQGSPLPDTYVSAYSYGDNIHPNEAGVEAAGTSLATLLGTILY